MDSIQLYNFHFLKVFNVVKRIVIPILIQARDSNRPYNYIYNKIYLKFREEIVPRYRSKVLDKHPDAFKFYQRGDLYYEGDNETTQKLVLDNEIYKYFKNRDLSLLKPFIVDLAIYNAVDAIERHLKDYYGYLELVYQKKKYDYFYLKPFDDLDYKNSDEYKEMLGRKYSKHIKTEDQDQEGVIVSTGIKTDTEAKNLVNQQNKKTIDDFTDDERLIIANIFFNLYKGANKKKNEITLPSFLKLTKIVGGCSDDSIYLIKGTYGTPYYKANKGVDHYTSNQTKLQLLNSIILKLDKLGLSEVSTKLKQLKVKL